MEQKFEQLKHETEHRAAVLSLEPSTFKVKDLAEIIAEVVRARGVFDLIVQKLNSNSKGTLLAHLHHTSMFSECGTVCEILCPGKPGWQKGKVRIGVYLEFCPDEPEQTQDSLEGIRQSLNSEI